MAAPVYEILLEADAEWIGDILSERLDSPITSSLVQGDRLGLPRPSLQANPMEGQVASRSFEMCEDPARNAPTTSLGPHIYALDLTDARTQRPQGSAADRNTTPPRD